LAYQADSPLSHRSAVTALGLDRHEEALAAGDARGTVKIWRVKDGKLIYKEELAVAVGGLLFC
jgi:urease accessory protein UreH